MRRFVASFSVLACIMLSFSVPPAGAAPDKQLQNLKGSVSHGQSASAQQAIAAHATAVVQDNETAETGANSLGGLVLPDSSRVLLGSDTQLRVDSFSQTDVANAHFFIARGKVRFTVQHPKGSRANYTFQTPTAQIAVRGTEGDVAVGNNSLQINVYQLSDPNLPVNVVLSNGQVFVLHAGQSLILNFGAAAAAASGGVQSTVGTVSQSTYAPFSEFGAPVNAAALGIAPAVVAHFALVPLISAIVVDTAIVTATSHTTTSTVAGPNNTTVPVHVQISVPIIRFP